ncbi:MAG: hypothetical protein D6736_07530 [Nitrospinota bacterium]|nr:MAG: hypothetical protein D6736_07530 [Nitrospinota bacterium]
MDSPFEVCSDLLILEGSMVIIEAGVEVRVDAAHTLSVAGVLTGQGTAQNPITISGGMSSSIPAIRVFGTLDLDFVHLSGRLITDAGGSTLLSNCTLQGGFLSNPELTEPRYVQLDRCTIHSGRVDLVDGTLVLRDTTFFDSSASVLRGYVLLDNVDVDQGSLSFNLQGQPLYIDNVTITNAPAAALHLAGSDFGNDYFIGPNVVLQNNLYPVSVSDGGLLPGSTLPATGNVKNFIKGPENDVTLRGPFTWADAGLPYVIEGNVRGGWTILPGVTIRFGPGGGIADAQGLVARGLPDAPVTFEPLNPAQPWLNIFAADRLEHCIVEGSRFGLVNLSTLLPRYIDSCILRNNQQAVVGPWIVRGTRFLNNDLGARIGFPDDLNGQANPNHFVGNGLAVQEADDARFNWWGDPSGPATEANPGGKGDPVAAGVPVIPFRTEEPDASDSPPVVRLLKPYFLAEPAQKIMIAWDAQDDIGIVGYRILFSPASNMLRTYVVIADRLPASQHAFEWRVPHLGFQVLNEPQYIRVVAIDTAGQEGWDESALVIPTGDVTANLSITSDLGGKTFHPGEEIPVTWTIDNPLNTVTAFVFLDGDQRSVSLGGAPAGLGELPLATAPFFSTDTARIGIRIDGTSNAVKWVFSDYFSIRPDPRIGDTPPVVTLLSPAGGERFVAGTTIPITWMASDDEALRSFDIQASYDGGRTWHLIADDLPADTTSFDWQTAPGTGFPDVRIRIVATDLRFQNSSAGADRAFSITRAEQQVFSLFTRVRGRGRVTSTPVGIRCPGDCTAAYPQGTLVAITATPARGWRFLGWGGSCRGIRTPKPCVVTMKGNRFVRAVFIPRRTIQAP